MRTPANTHTRRPHAPRRTDANPGACDAARVPVISAAHDDLPPDLAREVRRLLAQALVADLTAYPTLVAEDTADSPAYPQCPPGIAAIDWKRTTNARRWRAAPTWIRNRGLAGTACLQPPLDEDANQPLRRDE